MCLSNNVKILHLLKGGMFLAAVRRCRGKKEISHSQLRTESYHNPEHAQFLLSNVSLEPQTLKGSLVTL
jgi:hypothetical protein